MDDFDGLVLCVGITTLGACLLCLLGFAIDQWITGFQWF